MRWFGVKAGSQLSGAVHGDVRREVGSELVLIAHSESGLGLVISQRKAGVHANRIARLQQNVRWTCWKSRMRLAQGAIKLWCVRNGQARAFGSTILPILKVRGLVSYRAIRNLSHSERRQE